MPFLIDVDSIFPPNLPPKIDSNPSKIDAKMPSKVHSFFDRFLIDVCSHLRPTEPKESFKSYRFWKYSCKIGLSKLTSIFDSMLLPIWIYFGIINPPKSNQRSIPRGIKKMIDFWIDFLFILVPFCEPNWGHAGHFFIQNTGTLTKPWPFFVGLFFSFFGRFGAMLAPFGALLARSWLDVRSLWFHFGFIFCTKLALSWGILAQGRGEMKCQI